MSCLYCNTACCGAKCQYAECPYAECRSAECHYAECRYAECRYAECRNAECRRAMQAPALVSAYQKLFKAVFKVHLHLRLFAALLCRLSCH